MNVSIPGHSIRYDDDVVTVIAGGTTIRGGYVCSCQPDRAWYDYEIGYQGALEHLLEVLGAEISKD